MTKFLHNFAKSPRCGAGAKALRVGGGRGGHGRARALPRLPAERRALVPGDEHHARRRGQRAHLSCIQLRVRPDFDLTQM